MVMKEQRARFSVIMHVAGDAEVDDYIAHGSTLGQAVGRAVRRWEHAHGDDPQCDGITADMQLNLHLAWVNRRGELVEIPEGR